MRTSRSGLALVGVLALLWGSNFLWIKVALDGLNPVQITFGRMAAGAAVLWFVVSARREPMPRDRGILAHLAVAAFFGNVAPYLLFAIGEQSVDSALAGVLNATAPLWTVAIAIATRHEASLAPAKAAGLPLGFVGTVLILEPWHAASGTAGGQIACLAAALSYGVSYVYMSRYLADRGPSAVVLACGQLTAATVLLIPALVVAGLETTQLSSDVLGSMLALGPLGTGVAYIVNYAIIRRDGATIASTVSYLLPVVSVALGAAVLGERLSSVALVGTAVVLVGVALSRSTPRRPRLATVKRRERASPSGDS